MSLTFNFKVKGQGQYSGNCCQRFALYEYRLLVSNTITVPFIITGFPLSVFYGRKKAKIEARKPDSVMEIDLGKVQSDVESDVEIDDITQETSLPATSQSTGRALECFPIKKI